MYTIILEIIGTGFWMPINIILILNNDKIIKVTIIALGIPISIIIILTKPYYRNPQNTF